MRAETKDSPTEATSGSTSAAAPGTPMAKPMDTSKRGMQEGQTGKEEMRQQQTMKVMDDITKENRLKGRMDAIHSWWLIELLAADCEKALLHPGWEDTFLRWYECEEKRQSKEDGIGASKNSQSCDHKC